MGFELRKTLGEVGRSSQSVFLLKNSKRDFTLIQDSANKSDNTPPKLRQWCGLAAVAVARPSFAIASEIVRTLSCA